MVIKNGETLKVNMPTNPMEIKVQISAILHEIKSQIRHVSTIFEISQENYIQPHKRTDEDIKGNSTLHRPQQYSALHLRNVHIGGPRLHANKIKCKLEIVTL